MTKTKKDPNKSSKDFKQTYPVMITSENSSSWELENENL